MNKTPCSNKACPHYKEGITLNCAMAILPMSNLCDEYRPDQDIPDFIKNIFGGFK